MISVFNNYTFNKNIIIDKKISIIKIKNKADNYLYYFII